MNKILVSDIDGTFLFDNKISSEDKKAFQLFKENGGTIVINTGRFLPNVSFLKSEDIPYDYIITGDGSTISNSNHDIIRQTLINKEKVYEIFSNHIKNNLKTHAFFVGCHNQVYVIGNINKQIFTNDFQYKYIEDLEEFSNFLLVDECIHGFYIKDNVKEHQGKHIMNSIISQYESDFTITKYDNAIEVAPYGCSKGSAVLSLKGIADMEDYDVYAIGDERNDISMFDIAKESFSFPHAHDDAKNRATTIVKDIAECVEIILKK